MSVAEWGEFQRRRHWWSGVYRVGNRRGDPTIGKHHCPNRTVSSEHGVACSLTSMGNSGWYLQRTEDGKHMGIRMLTGDEFLRSLGYVGRHALRSEDYTEEQKMEISKRDPEKTIKGYYSEAMKKEIAGNAVSALPSSRTTEYCS